MPTIRFNTHFPGYEVLSELGRSNARILKARHLATGDLVAIKHFALNTDPETLRRFQQESTIMTAIAHPNIVKVREVQLEAELPFLVMELIEGGNTQQLIAQQKLDVTTVTRLGLQMASALKAIHSQGIIHRDVKPENILYRNLSSGELHFLLTDFGVARLHERSNTMTGQSLMTYEYASPEQFNDPRNVTNATDYYSLGVVLYQCLFGSVPFRLEDYSGIATFMNRVLTESPPALASLSADQPLHPFAALLTGLLQKNPAERLSDPDELTWMLKQAELNYLQNTRTAHSGPAASVTAKAPPISASPKVYRESAGQARLEMESSGRRAQPATSSSSRVLKVGALVLSLLVAIAGVYVISMYLKGGDVEKQGLPSILSDSPEEDLPLNQQAEAEEVDSTKIKLEEANRRREQLRKEALAAVESLTSEVVDYRVGIFGGIKNIRIELKNPSQISFESIAVKVNYYKEKGGLFKTEKIFFNKVGPQSSFTKRAPDSNRGTRVSCSVSAHQYTRELDSLLRNPPPEVLP